MYINAAVADLRNAPKAASGKMQLPSSSKINPLQASQLLFGEPIIVQKEITLQDRTKWLKINAIAQPRYSSDLGWHGFPGWIQKNQAVTVAKYAACNLVIKSLTAPLLDENGNKKETLVMGSRLVGIKHTSNLWKITLPDQSSAWIQDKDVYFIDNAIKESEDELRQAILANAMKYLGFFYSWGGRSPQNNHFNVSSVDCSAFINLLFCAHGLQVPRNAHDQFLTTTQIPLGKNLKVGDLVFFSAINSDNKNKTPRMDHVLMYIGNGNLIESTLSGKGKVRIISFKKRIGYAHDQMKSGDISQRITTATASKYGNYVYFGSYFTKTKLQALRYNFLNPLKKEICKRKPAYP